MFIGRERELRALQEQYDKTGFAMTVIYGRRRVGKTTLIAKFIEGKKAIFYTASKVGADRNLELLAKEITAVMDPAYENASFASLEDLLDFFTAKLTGERTILVIDELPYWAQKDESILSILQKYIDTRWLDKNVFLLLCGSVLSFMEDKVLSEKSPLFGRRSSQIRLEAFDYIDSARFVPGYTREEQAICYGITGGVARYLAMLDDSISLDDNIKRLFFRPDGYLYDEPRNLLSQEFADVSTINNIIEQLASGENSLNIISDRLRERPQTILYSVNRLIETGLAERRTCITQEDNRKKIQYVLKDSMFKFWYAFIPKATSLIETGHGDLYYDNVVKPELHSFMRSVFEDMCRHFTLEQGVTGRFGGFITNVGSWWGTETLYDESGRQFTQSADIDVVALSAVDHTAAVGECKFRNAKADKSVYDTLVRRSGLISGKYRVTRLLIFSLGGYTEHYSSLNDERLMLFTLDDLYR